jgi:peptidoglycan lytic transglycosylase
MALCLAALFAPLIATGCGGGHKVVRESVPPPPSITKSQPPASEESPEQSPSSADDEKIVVPHGTKPILTETGLASWYGAPYNHRRGSNGKVYNMHAMTAAHRTLPLGSIVRVTNLKTKHSAVVRITDRGPFVEGRIIDLSLAAAKKVDVWAPGTAMVKLEVLQAPAPIDKGGRWAVQIGAFDKEHAANDLANHIARRYHTAKVLRFSSPVGDWWVRVRVKDDDRARAEEIAHDVHTREGNIFLVRLD